MSPFRERARVQLATPGLGAAIGHAMDVRAEARERVFGNTDVEALRRAARAIRAHTIANLPEYLDRFADAADAGGASVFFASTAGEAVAHVLRIVRERGARLVVKSKSMVAEEIDLNAALERDGVEVVETDLGEHIVQIANERPSHITVPAVHKTRAQVRELFERVYGARLSDDPAEITGFARGVLRERFLRADVGITGVNFGVASTGSLVIVTNEGNGRMSTSLPRVHIAVMGMERIVPSFRELSVLLPLLTASATGQRITAYVNVVNGPRRGDEPDGPEELHIVILDNGRSALLSTEYRSVLHCIRCGACQNVCPVFRQVGGHAYGGVYGGPIGAVLTPLMDGFESAGDLPHASTLCAACSDACPVGIPIHELLIALRRDATAEQAGRAERLGFALWSRLWSSAPGYRTSVRLARLAQRPFARAGRLRRAPFPLSRWTSSRDLPALAKESFRERWRRAGGA
jgi:L-lactate dehydrogenase complex protein LldF